MAFTIGGYATDVFPLLLSAHLPKGAAVIFDGLDSTIKNNVEKVGEALAKQLDHNDEERAFEALFARCRAPDEPVIEYAGHTLGLARKAYPGMKPLELHKHARRAFIKGLDNDLKKLVEPIAKEEWTELVAQANNLDNLAKRNRAERLEAAAAVAAAAVATKPPPR